MSRYDFIFAGTRLIGVFFAAQFIMSIPGMLRQLFSWNFIGGFWGLVTWVTTGVVAFALSVGTSVVLERIGESPAEAPEPPAA